MRILKKILILLLMINALFVCLNLSKVQALTLTDMESDAKNFMKAGSDAADKSKIDTSTITSNFVGLGRILTFVGAGVMVAVVAYMGIKYMVSPPDQQAALKQQLIGVVAAGIVIFGAYGIWKGVLAIVSKF